LVRRAVCHAGSQWPLDGSLRWFSTPVHGDLSLVRCTGSSPWWFIVALVSRACSSQWPRARSFISFTLVCVREKNIQKDDEHIL
jgi:hypothetical protein